MNKYLRRCVDIHKKNWQQPLIIGVVVEIVAVCLGFVKWPNWWVVPLVLIGLQVQYILAALIAVAILQRRGYYGE